MTNRWPGDAFFDMCQLSRHQTFTMYQWKPFLVEQVFNVFPNFIKDDGTTDWTMCWPGTTTFRDYFASQNDLFTALLALLYSIDNKFA